MQRITAKKVKPLKGGLNKLQAAQLTDCINAGMNVKVSPRAKGPNKGYFDTPLFKIEEPKLF